MNVQHVYVCHMSVRPQVAAYENQEQLKLGARRKRRMEREEEEASHQEVIEVEEEEEEHIYEEPAEARTLVYVCIVMSCGCSHGNPLQVYGSSSQRSSILQTVENTLQPTYGYCMINY